MSFEMSVFVRLECAITFEALLGMYLILVVGQQPFSHAYASWGALDRCDANESFTIFSCAG